MPWRAKYRRARQPMAMPTKCTCKIIITITLIIITLIITITIMCRIIHIHIQRYNQQDHIKITLITKRKIREFLNLFIYILLFFYTCLHLYYSNHHFVVFYFNNVTIIITSKFFFNNLSLMCDENVGIYWTALFAAGLSLSRARWPIFCSDKHISNVVSPNIHTFLYIY